VGITIITVAVVVFGSVVSLIAVIVLLFDRDRPDE
jgi:hypothetical protein